MFETDDALNPIINSYKFNSVVDDAEQPTTAAPPV